MTRSRPGAGAYAGFSSPGWSPQPPEPRALFPTRAPCCLGLPEPPPELEHGRNAPGLPLWPLHLDHGQGTWGPRWPCGQTALLAIL